MAPFAFARTLLEQANIFDTPERLGETPRYWALNRLNQYYGCTQDDNKPDWYSGRHHTGEIVPLRERKPCLPEDLPRQAVEQVTSFTFGEGRFPAIEVEDLEAEEALEPALAVSEDEAEALTTLVGELIRSACLKSGSRTLLRRGLSVGTSPTVLAIRRGLFTVETPQAQDCIPIFEDDDPAGDVVAMTWCYRFNKLVKQGTQLVELPHYFRRDFTDTEYVVYEDALYEVGKTINWVRDEARTKQHKLGFCPVVWIRNQPESHCNSIDGVSLFESPSTRDKIDALNFALSQRHRGINFFGVPQAYETDVGDDEDPAEHGRVARTPKRKTDSYVSNGGEIIKPDGSRVVAEDAFWVNKPARKMAPDQIWSYKGKAQLGVLETSGKAFEVASKHIDDLSSRALRSMRVVMLDPNEMSKRTDISGKALAMIYAPMLALVDELREHWWEHGLAKILSMMMRIIAITEGKGLLIPGAAKCAKILKRFMVAVETEDKTLRSMWMPPKMTPCWGDYFSPTNDEINIAVQAASKAKTDQLVKGSTATKYVAPYFGIEDPEKEAEEIEADAVKNAEEALAAAQTEVDAMPADAEPADDAKDAEPVTKPEPAATKDA